MIRGQRIEPVHGRWVWPFAQMQAGDWFLVAHADRDPDALRNLVSVRGSQLAKRFSFTKHHREGIAKVECLGEMLRIEDVMG